MLRGLVDYCTSVASGWHDYREEHGLFPLLAEHSYHAHDSIVGGLLGHWAVWTQQAVELLPVWQVYQEVSTSDTVAQAEVDALIEQIQETLTTEQMDAINGMNLTQQDIFTIMQECGIQFGGGQNANQGGGSQNGDVPSGGFQGGGGFPGGDGGFPGGAPPDGGGVPGGDFGGGAPQGMSEDQIATAQAARQGQGRDMMSPMLINALIELLKSKAGS